MRFCSLIAKETVFNKAIYLVRSARKEIFVTMNVDEELLKSLPNSYHELLKLKVKKGIKVIRYGYGSKKAYKLLKNKYSYLTFMYLGPLRYYQRMLIVDKSRGLLAVEGQTLLTEFKPLLESLVKYAQLSYNKEKL